MNAVAPTLQCAGRPAWVDADGARRLVGWLAGLYAGLALAVLAAAALAPDAAAPAMLAGAALLIPLAGLLGTLPLARARASTGWAGSAGRLARRPQGVIVPAAGGCAMALLAAGGAAAGLAGPHALAAGLAALVLGFPLLVAERMMDAVRPSSLPEAADLRALLFVPVLGVPLAGLLQVGAATGVPFMTLAAGIVSAALGVIAAELSLRALANWFLPAPPDARAVAATACLSARLLQPGRLAPAGLAAPIRTHLGIDFSRSWALRFARSAALPVGLVLGLIAWGLTGVTLIEQDRRGIYERFGAASAVWAPGAHLGLPWPLGRVRRVDLGVVHAVALGGDAAAERRSPAEAAAPASADRLWNQMHPQEVSYLLASRESDGTEGFQTVNVDLTVLYRIGPDDADALKAAYAVERPDALVRAEAGRLMARELAGTVLADAMGAGRETLAETLRARLQAALDGFDTGIRVDAVAIEAIHPPPAAADAFHAVQAAEIVATTAISTERGRALAAASRDRQQASELVLGAEGIAAETAGRAEVAGRVFAADRAAAAQGEASFRLERYLASVAAALATSPLVIVDRDLTGAEAPAIDLRSYGAPAPRAAGDE